MPTSPRDNISKILSIIVGLNPQKVLDIGAGFGKYGVLCREYLDIFGNLKEGKANSGEDYTNWTRTIDAIEAYKVYITPLHEFVYDNIFIGDAFELVKNLTTKYDLILLIDILEHFDKDRGEIFIKRCLDKSNSVMISIPKYTTEQSASFGNEFECHRSNWTKKELKKLGDNFFISTYNNYIILLSNKSTIKNFSKYHFTEKLKVFPLSKKIYLYISRKFPSLLKKIGFFGCFVCGWRGE